MIRMRLRREGKTSGHWGILTKEIVKVVVGKDHKIIFSLFTLGISVIIALIIAELLVRYLQLEDRLQEVHFARNSQGHIAGADPVSEGCRFKISSNRDLVYEPRNPPMLPEKKQPGELRILCLGDSVVDNIWRKRLVTFPGLLSEEINNNPISHWKSCTVINAGVTGYNPVLEYEWYKQQWQDGRFDVVILCYCCANDRSENRQIVRDPDGTVDDLFCYNVREYIPYIFNFPGHRFLLESSALFRLINSRLAPYLENWGIEIEELDLDRVPVIRDAILDLRDLCERNGSRFILVIIPRLRPEEREHRWIMDLVRSAGIEYIDVRAIFERTGYNNYLSKKNDGSVDYTHPNQLGHEIITDLIINKL